jgi:hypothetical protein
VALRKLKRAKKAQPEGVAYPELEEMLATLKKIQDEGWANQQRFWAMETAIIKFMGERGITTYDRGELRGTVVPGETEVVDWVAIQKRLGPRRWKQILGQPQPDKDKLKALIEVGIVKPEEVNPFITGKAKKTFVKVTRRS